MAGTESFAAGHEVWKVEAECPVCRNDFPDGSVVTVYNCGHFICRQCHHSAKSAAKRRGARHACHLCRKQEPMAINLIAKNFEEEEVTIVGPVHHAPALIVIDEEPEIVVVD